MAERDASSSEILRIEGLGKSFRGAAVLKDVNLAVRRGETVAIIGPSGSGKTTLLRSVNFLTPYDTGRVLINGELMGYSEKDGERRLATDAATSRLRRSTGMVFQRFALFQHMTVLRNLIEGPVHVLGLSREEAAARARAALATVGLAGKEDSYPAELSGGQQQRVGIARALCMEPDILLFDEPTSALDPELRREVLAVMRQLAAEGMTMMIVTHEMGFARHVGTRVVFMDKGELVEEGAPATFFGAPSTERARKFLQQFED